MKYMETEIIEPNPLLIEYVKISNSLWTEFDNLTQLMTKTEHLAKDEWHYIMSNLEQNIFLLKRLDEKSLLPDEVNICDAGVGLGAALFDLYIQSKELKNKKFTFSGVEKQEKYIEYFNKHLVDFWNGDLNFITGDIMNQDYSHYDIVYSYSPYMSPRDLLPYYTKLKNDIKPGSLIIENRAKGLGLDSTLAMVDGLEKIQIDDIYVFRKL
jgi:hypothetical protein